MSLQLKNEELIQCPYDKAHVILISRMQFHLVKCGKNHKELVDCKFNATHKVPAEELVCHMTYFCPDRRKYDTFVAQPEENEGPLFPVEPVDFQSTEVWDDSNCPTYDPGAALETRAVLYIPQGKTPSERKKFRLEERQRHQLFQKQAVSAPVNEATTTTRLPQTVPRVKMLNEPSTSKGITSSKQHLEQPQYRAHPDLNNQNGADDEGFVVPRYASRGRGRGRGRIHSSRT